MSKVHVKKGDNVYVLTGKDAGKTGKVLAVFADKSRVIVEGVNMAVKHKKPTGRNQQGGIIEQEASIHSSNLMIVCPKCKRPAKFERRVADNGEKTRVCKKCGEVLDVIRAAKK